MAHVPITMTLGLGPQAVMYYEQLFKQADVGQKGIISGETTRSMFMLCNPTLDNNMLGLIWRLSDRQKQRALTKDDFFIALRLIALAQNKIEPSYENLTRTAEQQILPLFNGIQVPKLQQQQQSTPQSSPPNESKNDESDWSMSSDEEKQYAIHFKNADLDQDNYISGQEAQMFFTRSGLDAQTLGRIWKLSDVDGDRKLSQEEFYIAMHLVMRVRKHFVLPTTLPDVLHPSMRHKKQQQHSEIVIPESEPVVPPVVQQQQQPQDMLSMDEAFAGLGGNDHINDADISISMLDHHQPTTSVTKSPSMNSNMNMNNNMKQRSVESGIADNRSSVALNNMRQEVEQAAQMQSQLSNQLTSSVEQLEIEQMEIEKLQNTVGDYKKQHIMLQERIRFHEQSLLELQDQKQEYMTILEEQQEILQSAQETSQLMEEKLIIANEGLAHVKSMIEEKKRETEEVKRQHSLYDSGIEQTLRQQDEAKLMLLEREKELKQLKHNLRGVEELKTAQEGIWSERNKESDRLKKEREDLQEMLAETRAEIKELREKTAKVKEANKESKTKNVQIRDEFGKAREELKTLQIEAINLSSSLTSQTLTPSSSSNINNNQLSSISNGAEQKEKVEADGFMNDLVGDFPDFGDDFGETDDVPSTTTPTTTSNVAPMVPIVPDNDFGDDAFNSPFGNTDDAFGNTDDAFGAASFDDNAFGNDVFGESPSSINSNNNDSKLSSDDIKPQPPSEPMLPQQATPSIPPKKNPPVPKKTKKTMKDAPKTPLPAIPKKMKTKSTPVHDNDDDNNNPFGDTPAEFGDFTDTGAWDAFGEDIPAPSIPHKNVTPVPPASEPENEFEEQKQSIKPTPPPPEDDFGTDDGFGNFDDNAFDADFGEGHDVFNQVDNNNNQHIEPQPPMDAFGGEEGEPAIEGNPFGGENESEADVFGEAGENAFPTDEFANPPSTEAADDWATFGDGNAKVEGGDDEWGFF